MTLADAAVLHGIDHFNWVQTIKFPAQWAVEEVTVPTDGQSITLDGQGVWVPKAGGNYSFEPVEAR